MRILVTGADGQLGRELQYSVQRSRPSDLYVFTNRAQLDLSNTSLIARYFASHESFDVVINAAAYTHVEQAETNHAEADFLNNEAVAHLANQVKAQKGTLFHISTDYVFDGCAHRPYQETDAPHPINYYGLSKLRGEQAIREVGCRAIILRTSWLYSALSEKNFFATMKRLTASKPQIKVVADQWGTPTYARDLATAIIQIIATKQQHKTGLYHYSNEGTANWYQFAQAINQRFQHGCIVSPCTTAEFPTKAQRPAYSVLDKSLFKSTFGLPIPLWQDSLDIAVSQSQSAQNRPSTPHHSPLLSR